MKIPFEKYQATGNDFVLVDQRFNNFINIGDQEGIQHICDRRFGIGADGLILLQMKDGYDFEMVYFNSDGRQSTMCGNGGRCIVKYAHNLGVINEKCLFKAIDGDHQALLMPNGWIKLHMIDVPKFTRKNEAYILETGSPHFVQFIDDVPSLDVPSLGAKIRYSPDYMDEGINVNFVENRKDGLFVRTYERGVENETYSCGTGVTAAALAASRHIEEFQNAAKIDIETPGGELEVHFQLNGDGFNNIWLCGPAEQVFSGEIEI